MQVTEIDKKSSSRNPLIFGLFQRMDMVEQVGSGIRRIKTDIREAGLPEPVFKTKGMFTIVFQRNKLGVKLGVNEQSVFNAIQNNPEVTIPEMAKLIGVSTTSIENNLKKLKDKQIVERVGSDKTGHWAIIENEENI